jgi:hypothetical protein
MPTNQHQLAAITQQRSKMNTLIRGLRYYVAIGLLCFVTEAHSEQESGSIAISAVDAVTERRLGRFQVTITARDGQEWLLQQSEHDSLNSPALVVGLYRVEVTRMGYQSAVERSVRVVADKIKPLRVALRRTESEAPIEELIVLANPVNSIDQNGSAAASYYDREALRSSPGSGSDVLRALDGLPGLVSTGDFASFTVRGRGPRDNLILVDEVPFSKVVHFDESLGEDEDVGGSGRFSIFAPNIVEGVEYHPGGWSSAYGGRSGSLLKLKVAEGNVNTPSFTTRLDLAGLELGYDGPSYIHKDTSVLFSARQLDFGNFFELIGEDDLADPEITDVILKTKSKINESNSLEVLIIHAPETIERTLDNALASPNFDDVLIFDNEQDNNLINIGWHFLFGQSGKWKSRVYHRNTDKTSRMGESFPDLAAPNTPASSILVRENILTLIENETEYGLRSDLSLLNTFGELRGGIRLYQLELKYQTLLKEDWIRFVYDENDFRQNDDQRYIVLTPDRVNAVFNDDALFHSAYLEQDFNTPNSNLRLGIRHDHDGFSKEDLISPRMAYNFDASASISLAATAGVFFQAPRFTDRASNALNTMLENEKVTQLSLGFNFSPNEHWNISAESYFQDLDNLVVISDRTRGVADNKGTGYSSGLDLTVNRYFADSWSSNFTYSYNQSKIDDNNGEESYYADFNRPHSFSASLSWEINYRWKLATRWKFSSGRPSDDFIIHEDVLADENGISRFSKELTSNNTERLEDYHSLNLRVDYYRAIGKTDIIAFIDIINLYAADNTNNVEFNERTGTNIAQQGGVFPMFGFRLEW